MKYKKQIIIISILVILYIILQTINYWVEFNIEEYKSEVSILQEEISDLEIELNTNLSRDKAIHEYNLKLYDNEYYIEENDEK